MISFPSLAFLFVTFYSVANAADDWDYKQQGDDWPGLGICDGTVRQSPIDIVTANVEQSTEPLLINYNTPTSSFKIYNSNHSIEVEPLDSRGTITVNGSRVFTVAQLHFHAKSEHSIDENKFSLEAHIVHTTENSDDLVVIGITFAEFERPSVFLQELLASPGFPPATGEAVMVGCADLGTTCLGLDTLVPQGSSFFRYEGSLTTPTCDERVTWFVAKHPIYATNEQLTELATLFKYNGTEGNYRNVQPYNRPITEVPAESSPPQISSGSLGNCQTVRVRNLKLKALNCIERRTVQVSIKMLRTSETRRGYQCGIADAFIHTLRGDPCLWFKIGKFQTCFFPNVTIDFWVSMSLFLSH